MRRVWGEEGVGGEGAGGREEKERGSEVGVGRQREGKKEEGEV